MRVARSESSTAGVTRPLGATRSASRSTFSSASPNKLGHVQSGTFSSFSFAEPKILAHETLHLVGLDDRYGDFYSVGGRKYPYPGHAPSKTELTEFAKNHRPPLPPPPAGKIVVANLPGTGRCDIMGTDAGSCARIARRDLKILESQAGVQVHADPGDLLLNKSGSNQHYGVGFGTSVFAAPGQKTTAEGVSVYCINYSLPGPDTGNGFDVIGHASEVPGFEPVATLLELSGRLQPALDTVVPGMQGAIWNVTDGTSTGSVNDTEEAKALLSQAGIAEDSFPTGLPYIVNPNAGSPDTMAVTREGVVETIPSEPTRPVPAVRVQYAKLYPSPLSAAAKVRADLYLSTFGHADRVAVTVQRRAGRRWRKLRRLRPQRVKATVVPLQLGKLRTGRHRLVVAVSAGGRTQGTVNVAFSVR